MSETQPESAGKEPAFIDLTEVFNVYKGTLNPFQYGVKLVRTSSREITVNVAAIEELQQAKPGKGTFQVPFTAATQLTMTSGQTVYSSESREVLKQKIEKALKP